MLARAFIVIIIIVVVIVARVAQCKRAVSMCENGTATKCIRNPHIFLILYKNQCIHIGS